MPAVLVLLPLTLAAPDRPYPTMQACERAAPAIARRAGPGVVPVCVTRTPKPSRFPSP